MSNYFCRLKFVVFEQVMDTQKLFEALEAMLSSYSEEQQTFIRATQQVWEIDWTVSPYTIYSSLLGRDFAFFTRFMAMDGGGVDDKEQKLLIDLIKATFILQRQQGAMVSLIQELNDVRDRIR